MSSLLSFCKRYFVLFAFFLLAIYLIWAKSGGLGMMSGSREMDRMTSSESSYYPSDAFMMDSEEYDDNIRVANPAQAESKIIKTASLSIQVDEVRVAVEEVQDLIAEVEGEVAYSNVYLYTNAYRGDMTLRVPSERLSEALDALKELAIVVENESLGSQDVTEAYMDLQARLNNLRAEEVQYVNILASAVSVEDVLKVTQELSRVRYEIESSENTLKYYDQKVDYSEITLTLTEDAKLSAVSEHWRPGQDANNAFRDWVGFLQGLVSSVIYVVVFVWPLILVIALAWYLNLKRGAQKKK